MAKGSSFKPDNPVFRSLGRLGDLVGLNVLWLLCCLPVVTAGAATTALFYVARKMALGETCFVRRDFFRSFRANWKQGALLGLGFLLTGALFFFDLWVGLHTDSALGNLFRGVGVAFAAVWLAVMGFAFPTLARYEYRLGRLVVDSLRLCVAKPHITLVQILLAIWLPGLLWLDPNLFLFCLPLWLLVGPAASAVALSALLAPVQEAFEAQNTEDTGHEA